MSNQKIDGPAVGIDLGTTYSCVAIWQNERVEIIPNDHGNRITSSCVAFTETQRLIGDAARSQAATNAERTVSAFALPCKVTRIQCVLCERRALCAATVVLLSRWNMNARN